MVRPHRSRYRRYSLGDMVYDYLHLDQSTSAAKLQFAAVGGVLLLAAYATRQLGSPIASHVVSVFAGLWLVVPVISLAIDHLRKRRVSLHELAILAVLGAFASGYYLEAGVIAFVIVTSVFLYTRIARRARSGLVESAIVAPPAAIRLDGEHETETDSTDLAPGDIIRLRVGDYIPADGKVVNGYATINERAVNGTSTSVDKTLGDAVFAGSVNTYGSIDIQLTATGTDTWVRNRAMQLSHAYNTSSWVSWLIRRYGGWYTPVVLLIAAAAMIATNFMAERWERAIGMLLVASPSALILAIAASGTAATSCASRLGVLLRRATDLDRARRVDAVLFDETDGLAVGQYEITKYGTAEGVVSETLMQIAATALQHVNHPVADAVNSKARQYQVYPLHCEGQATETFEGGCRVDIEGVRYVVGRDDWLTAYSCKKTRQTLGPIVEEVRTSKGLASCDVLYVVLDGKVCGWLGLTEKPRTGAEAAIARMRELGVSHMELVTRQAPTMANKVARTLEIEATCNADVQTLRSRIKQLRQEGRHVAVVRNATNDSDSRPAGDLGFDLGSTRGQPPRHAKRIAVFSSNIGRVPFLIFLSQHTHRIVRRSMWITFAFVIAMMSVCAMGLISPIAAACIHAIFGIGLMFYSLRPLKLDKVAMKRERKVRISEMKSQYVVEKA